MRQAHRQSTRAGGNRLTADNENLHGFNAHFHRVIFCGRAAAARTSEPRAVHSRWARLWAAYFSKYIEYMDFYNALRVYSLRQQNIQGPVCYPCSMPQWSAPWCGLSNSGVQARCGRACLPASMMSSGKKCCRSRRAIARAARRRRALPQSPAAWRSPRRPILCGRRS